VPTAVVAARSLFKVILLGENKKVLIEIKIFAFYQSRRRRFQARTRFKMLETFGAKAVFVLLWNIRNNRQSFTPAGRSACGHLAVKFRAAAVANHPVNLPQMASIVQIYLFIMLDRMIARTAQIFALFSGLFITLTASYGMAAGFSCAQTHTSQSKFEFLDPRIHGPIRLGEGEFGTVDLRKNTLGQFIAVKTYKQKSSYPNSALIRDQRAFQFLFYYRSRFSFQIPKVQKVSDQVLKLDYYPGRTVADLFADPTVKPEIKSRIKTGYEKMVQELIEFLTSQQFDIDRNTVSGLPRISANNDSFSIGAIDILIKPDNVIVDPETLRLALIDPT
jgi:hypothetical protein